MEIQLLNDKNTILSYLNKDRALNIYSIGDLDEFFWPKTTWLAYKYAGDIKSIALLYSGMEIPTLLCFHGGDPYYSSMLLKQISHLLPERFYAHLSSGLIGAFGNGSVARHFGVHYKMILTKQVEKIADGNIRRLLVHDLPEIKSLYQAAYPDNWFDERMLETGKYFGYFTGNILAGISGIHVYSEEYKVAALGNIATHPDYRGKGIAFRLTSALCADLQSSVNEIGLNVRTDNDHAIRCYKKTGFSIIGTFDECLVKNI
jgi:ribosomal protein S18 acetylase RimI-like enzyme